MGSSIACRDGPGQQHPAATWGPSCRDGDGQQYLDAAWGSSSRREFTTLEKLFSTLFVTVLCNELTIMVLYCGYCLRSPQITGIGCACPAASLCPIKRPRYPVSHPLPSPIHGSLFTSGSGPLRGTIKRDPVSYPIPLLHSGVVIYIRGRTVYIDNVFRHGANDVLLLVELLASRMPIVNYHIH